MSHRLPEKIVRELEEALRCANMERANFDPVGSNADVVIKKGEHTKWIKEQTRLYRQSWIVGPIERILKWSQSTNDVDTDPYDIVHRLRTPLANPALLEDAAQEIIRLRTKLNELSSAFGTISGAVHRYEKDKTHG